MSVMLTPRTLRASAAPSAPRDWQPRTEDVTRVRRTLRRTDRRTLRASWRHVPAGTLAVEDGEN